MCGEVFGSSVRQSPPLPPSSTPPPPPWSHPHPSMQLWWQWSCRPARVPVCPKVLHSTLQGLPGNPASAAVRPPFPAHLHLQPQPPAHPWLWAGLRGGHPRPAGRALQPSRGPSGPTGSGPRASGASQGPHCQWHWQGPQCHWRPRGCRLPRGGGSDGSSGGCPSYPSGAGSPAPSSGGGPPVGRVPGPPAAALPRLRVAQGKGALRPRAPCPVPVPLHGH
jgi:hypothetical protein